MSEIIEATCPNCSRTKKIRREWLGRKVKCPCGNIFLLVYPAVKRVEVDQSLVVEPRKDSKARKKKCDIPIVPTFETKKIQSTESKRIQPTKSKEIGLSDKVIHTLKFAGLYDAETLRFTEDLCLKQLPGISWGTVKSIRKQFGKSVFSMSAIQQAKYLNIPVEEISAVMTNRGWSLDGVLYNKYPEPIAKEFYLSQGHSCEYGENSTISLLMHALMYPLFDKYNLGIESSVHSSLMKWELIRRYPKEVVDAISHSNEHHLRKGLRAVYRSDEEENRPLSDAHLVELWKLLGNTIIHELAKCEIANIGYMGRPDLTLIRDSKVFFVEVKTVDKLQSSQINWWLKVAIPLGLNCQITRLKEIAK